MTLQSSLAHYRLLKARIETLGQTAACGTDLTLLSRQMDEARARIADTAPRTSEEAAGKLCCLLALLGEAARDVPLTPEMAGLLEAARRTCSDLGMQPAAPVPRPSRPPAVFGGTMAEYVSFAEDDVMLVDRTYHITAVSDGISAWLGVSQVELMGLHLAEVIGAARFANRAQVRLDACFDGSAQVFHYARPCEGGARILCCDLRPVRAAGGAVTGALVHVSESGARIRSSGFRAGSARQA